uniref:RAP domain-containing protein n=2 Tax=Timema TaxID=61471 RepID=A0A7R8VIT2_TIMDO|nr:unnamed protein product [Timema douglasi]
MGSKLHFSMIRHIPWLCRRIVLRFTVHSHNKSSSAPKVAALTSVPCGDSSTTDKNVEPTHSNEVKSEEKVIVSTSQTILGSGTSDPVKSAKLTGKRNSIIETAFASLKEADSTTFTRHKTILSLEDKIERADSVETLLTLVNNSSVTRQHALRVVSVLADWTSSGRVKLADFEGDIRFVKMCKLLGKGFTSSSSTTAPDTGGFGDLAMVLGVTGDDEAAKLVAGISLSQMIRVLSTLANKRRRSTPLLRSLAFNIGRKTEHLDMKQATDTLYAMSVLNFPDELLLEKVALDLCECVPNNDRSAVVGSVLTSVGLMRYKHTELLDVLSDWVTVNIDTCRTQDLCSLLQTLAMLNYRPSNESQLFDVLLKHLTVAAVPNSVAWLDVVWSLVVLDRATPQHVTSVLSPEFLAKLTIGRGGNDQGPLLPVDVDTYKVTLTRSRDKKLLVSTIFDSFSNLLPSSTYLRTDIDTGMGFLLDGECVLDAKCNPIPVVEKAEANQSSNQKRTRIGIVAWDYHDLCRGVHNEPNGVAALGAQLLEKKGYKVMAIPHTEFNPRDKLVRRVQYLEQQLKNLAVENPTHQEIRDVLSAAGLKIGVENKLYSRERSKEMLYRGRIRVQIKNDDETLINPLFPTREL